MLGAKKWGCIGWALCAVLVGCGPEAESTVTLRLVERADTDAVVDLAPPGDSAGDLLTFANPLYDESNTTQVGTDQGYCVRTVAGQAWECTWTAFLADGQLTVAGPFYDSGDSSLLAIIGGAGTYQGARGQMQLEFRNPQGTEFNFIYQVLPGRPTF